MADLFDKIQNDEVIRRAKEATEFGMYPYFRALSDSEGTTATFEGKKVIMLGSNNYLGLTTDPRVRQAAVEAVLRYGTSVTGSRFLNGTLELHHELERRLAKFAGKEAAVVFSTGYQSNLGAISAVCGKDDFIILDKDDHASIVDGCVMSGAEMKRFRHNSLDNLDHVLSKLPREAGKLVVVDGVYSMGGDIAPVPEIVEVCRKYNARLMVDDAHGFGVTGQGHGTSWHFGVSDKVDLMMGTFSKSFASIGGFIAGDADVIYYIKHKARSLIFSAALPAPSAAAVLAALDIIETEPQHVQRLWDNADFMRNGLKDLGYNTGGSCTPIIPVITGTDFQTALAWNSLIEEGVYTNPVVPPATPPNGGLLRTSYTATHTREHLETALQAFQIVGERLDIINKPLLEPVL